MKWVCSFCRYIAATEAGIGFHIRAAHAALLPPQPRSTTMNETFGIGRAVDEMRTNGQRVTREGWNGKNQWLELQTPDANSKMTLPYVFITTVQGERVPWLCSQTDLLATDWQIYTSF